MKELDKAITALEEAKASIQAMLAQNNGLKTADDAQNNGKRWFFHLTTHQIASSFGKPCQCEEIVCRAWDLLIGKGDAIEVQESDLPYLEKPEGEWVFKKPVSGETIIEYGTGNEVVMGTVWNEIVLGYRWVKTPEVAPDVTPEENSAEVSRFVEYPIYQEDGVYYCDAKQSTGFIPPLHELPSIVGFAGVQFEEQLDETWHNQRSATVFNNEVYYFSPSYEGRPATPIKARFWIKTPTLNDK